METTMKKLTFDEMYDKWCKKQDYTCTITYARHFICYGNGGYYDCYPDYEECEAEIDIDFDKIYEMAVDDMWEEELDEMEEGEAFRYLDNIFEEWREKEEDEFVPEYLD